MCPTTRIDHAAVADALYGTWKAERLASRALASDARLQDIPGLPMREHRERVFDQAQLLVEAGAVQRAFPKAFGGEDNQGGNLAAFQELVYADPSLQIKSGVQWGLFGAAILQLGTAKHHERWLPDLMSLRLAGAFAMTEIGHGSDVAALATTAKYDSDAEEFVIHTPHRGAWKEFLGNAAVHGQAAVVFAQLITRDVNHGVHAFFVPIRTSEGRLLPGIESEDDGVKGGLNGVDNGRLCFTHVRVPREHLLNRYGDVAADGTYTSPIANPSRRFFTMLGTLVQGRVSLQGAAVNAMKGALAIAVQYGSERRQFAGASGTETVLLDYGHYRRRLLPRLAESYAMQFAGNRLLTMFDAVFSGSNDNDAQRQELETLAATLKPLATWAALDTLQAAREACGGAGFMAKNRLVRWRADLDVYATFEGDNSVLLQLVGKRLLSEYAAGLQRGQTAALVKAAANQLGERAARFGLRRIAHNVADLGRRSRSVAGVCAQHTQHALLKDRVATMVAQVAVALRRVSGSAAVRAGAASSTHQHTLIEAARAHGELLQWEAFTDALTGFEGDTLTVMTWLRDLYGMTLIERHLAWYLAHGRLSVARAEAVTAYGARLVDRIRVQALDLVRAFELTPELLRAEIATGIESERQRETQTYIETQRASGAWPVHERELYAQRRNTHERAAE